MSYRKEVEKSVKGYMRSQGFTYNAKRGFFVKKITDDIVFCIGFAYETHGKSQYYFLRIPIGIASISLDNILSEVTNGIIDCSKFHIGPIYTNCIDRSRPYSDYKCIHCEFFKNKPIEENIADLDRMYTTDAKRLLSAYSSQRAIYTCSAHREFFPFNPFNVPFMFFYGPLGYFFDGQFDKAFEFIEERVNIEKENIKRDGPYEVALKNIETYKIYRKNLKKWIADKRQFKVDDEYLPVYDE